MESREAVLSDVLEFRDKKARIQEQMAESIPNGIVVSLGMNIPGPVKCGPSIYRAFQEGRKELEWILNETGTGIRKSVILEEKAGYAAVYLIGGYMDDAEIKGDQRGPSDALKIKERTVELEETHLLGRLFDIDVFDRGKQPLTRQMVGADRRKCLICGRDAKECGRNRTHTVSELQEAVFEMIENWSAEQEI